MSEEANTAPLFLDISALLRAYLFKDPFYGQVQQAISQTQQVVVSGLAHPEFTAALMQRQHRDHPARLTAAQVARVLSDFQRDWDTLYVVGVDEALLLDASALVIRQAAFGLRAMDAVHLVSAQLAAVAFEELVFLTFDARQEHAALAEGLTLYRPPSEV